MGEVAQVCAGVRKTILAQEVYCTKPNTKPVSPSGYWFRKGIGTQYLWSIWEYDLATAITIWQLTQTLMCEMGSSIFVDMSRLKVASTTWAYLPSIS